MGAWEWIQNLPSGPNPVLERGGHSSKCTMYSSGWPPRSALALNLIEDFETTSRNVHQCSAELSTGT